MARVVTKTTTGLIIALSCCIAGPQTSAAQSAQSCWMVYFGRVPTPADNEDETLCIMSESSGFVREATLFGTGVEGCNSIKIIKKDGGVSLFVDYSNCTNDTPNHTMVCPSLLGDLVKCENKTDWPPDAPILDPDQVSDSYLKSCPAKRCDTPLRR